MGRRRLLNWWIVGVSCVVVPASCGGSDQTATDEPLVRAIADDVHLDPDAPFATEAEAECFAVELVGLVGGDRLAELGFSVEDIPDEFQVAWSPDEVDIIISSIESCVDVPEAARAGLPAELSDAEKDCILDELGDGFYLDTLRAQFEAGANQEMLAAVQENLGTRAIAAFRSCGEPGLVVGPEPAGSTTVAELGATGVIVFESDRDGNPEVYTLDIATGEVRRLTDHPAFDNAADWSPDGTRIVFQSLRDGEWGVHVMNADGSEVRQLAGDAGFPRWSPDGLRIVFVAGDGPDIHVMDPDGGNVVQLTTDPSFDSFPDWSPDGARIVFQSARTGGDEAWLMDADGGNLAQLPTPLFGGGPTWSPDGTRFAFHSDRGGNVDVYVADVDGSSVTRMTTDPGVDVYPDWSPDGAFLTFTSDRDGDFDLYLMTSDGSSVAPLTDNSDRDFGASWEPPS